MAVTIDKLDIGVYIQYARSLELVEQVKEQFQLDKASSIPPQTQLVEFAPKIAEIELLMGILSSRENPWAFFFPPMRFREHRRTPFSRHQKRVKNAQGQDMSEDDYLLELIEGVECKTEKESEEKELIKDAVKKRQSIEAMIEDIISHMGMFVQG